MLIHSLEPSQRSISLQVIFVVKKDAFTFSSIKQQISLPFSWKAKTIPILISFEFLLTKKNIHLKLFGDYNYNT